MNQLVLNIVELSKQIGLRFIIVESYAKANNFYIKNNFINLKKDENTLKKSIK